MKITRQNVTRPCCWRRCTTTSRSFDGWCSCGTRTCTESVSGHPGALRALVNIFLEGRKTLFLTLFCWENLVRRKQKIEERNKNQNSQAQSRTERLRECRRRRYPIQVLYYLWYIISIDDYVMIMINAIDFLYPIDIDLVYDQPDLITLIAESMLSPDDEKSLYLALAHLYNYEWVTVVSIDCGIDWYGGKSIHRLLTVWSIGYEL